MTRKDTTKAGVAPAHGHGGIGDVGEEIVVEGVSMRGLRPVRDSCGKGAAGGTLAVCTIAIDGGIDDQAMRATGEELLTEFLDIGIRETGADGDLCRDTDRAGVTYELPALPERWSPFEALEILLRVSFNRDGEPEIRNVLHEIEISSSER